MFLHRNQWYFALLIGFFIAAGCSSDDSSIEKPKEENQLKIEYSSPPFELSTSAKFAENIEYGSAPENVFDVFLPQSQTPTGMVIYIHGGAFIFGDKADIYNRPYGQSFIKSLLQNGQAFASINYNLLDQGEDKGVLASLKDAKRCLQFIRYYAEIFNINPQNIVLMGNSAGAGTSLWLAFHPNMAQPNAEDPVLRQSTRVKGAAVFQTQATYDLQRWEDEIFDEYNFSIEQVIQSNETLKSFFLSFYGIDSFSQFNSPEIQAYRNEVDMLGMLSANDPEFFVDNTSVGEVYPSTLNILFHHPYHARALRQKALAVGAEGVFYYGKNPPLYTAPSGETQLEFVLRKLSD